MSEIMANEPIATNEKLYTYADYLKFPYDEVVEIIKGKIYKMSPAPGSNHQAILIP